MLSKNDIKRLRELAAPAARRQSGLFVAEGGKLVDELAKAGMQIAELYTTLLDETSANALWPQATHVSRSEMERISQMRTPQQVLAVIEIPQHKLRKDHPRGGLSLVLDTIQDPGNLGTIIRLADWFGIDEVFCSTDTADCFGPKVVQATMGAIARVPVFYTDLSALLSQAEKPVYGTFLDGESLYTATISDPTSGYIVMGNEGRGISSPIEQLVTRRLLIPPATPHCVESLNVAVATAITCSEFHRQILNRKPFSEK